MYFTGSAVQTITPTGDRAGDVGIRAQQSTPPGLSVLCYVDTDAVTHRVCELVLHSL